MQSYLEQKLEELHRFHTDVVKSQYENRAIPTVSEPIYEKLVEGFHQTVKVPQWDRTAGIRADRCEDMVAEICTDIFPDGFITQHPNGKSKHPDVQVDWSGSRQAIEVKSLNSEASKSSTLNFNDSMPKPDSLYVLYNFTDKQWRVLHAKTFYVSQEEYLSAVAWDQIISAAKKYGYYNLAGVGSMKSRARKFWTTSIPGQK